MRKSFLWILIIILLSLPAIAVLMRTGFFQSDDGEWMIIRFSAFHQALRDGQFPVRFLSRLNYGYGYPVANFLYPGFMYSGEVLKLLGFGFVTTIKIIFGLSMVGSAVFSFLWLSKIINKWASFVGSMLYLYAPYHLFDLYKRGSVGEILALCIMPFTFWQIERRSFLWTSLGVAFLVLSHNSIALLFLPVILLYSITRSLASSVFVLTSVVLGLGLSSFFWLPAIFDLQYTAFYGTQVSEWSNYFASFGLIGILPILAFAWYLFKFGPEKNRISKFLFITGIFSLFFSVSISSFAWKILPVSFVQFPFRFLSILILSTSSLTAFLLNKIKGRNSFLLGALFIIIGFFSSLPYLTPQLFLDKGDLYYSTNEDTTTVKKEYMPIWVRNNPTERYKEKVEIIGGKISDLKINSNNISFVANSTKDAEITINTVYFPGWKTFIDGKNVQPNYIDNGFINVTIPSGPHTVRASFGETPVRLFSDIISLLSLLVIFFIVVNSRKSLSPKYEHS